MAELGGAAADAPRKANPQQTSRGAAMVLAAGSEIGATFISEMDRIGIEQVCSLHLLEEEEEEGKKDRTSSQLAGLSAIISFVPRSRGLSVA